MRPITVTAGPYAAAIATKIALAQRNTVAGGALALVGATTQTIAATQSPGAAALLINGSYAKNGVANIPIGQYISIVSGGNDSAITFLVVGIAGMANIVVRETVGGANAGAVSTQTAFKTILSITPSGAAAGTVAVGTFDPAPTDLNGVARRIVFLTVGNEVGNTATIYGFGSGGTPQSEVLALGGPAATVTSALDYVSVSKITIANIAAGLISVGTTTGTNAVITNPVGSSQWLRFDDYADAVANLQCVVAGVGSIAYVVQVSNDDPNSLTNPVPPALMTWSMAPDAAIGTPGTPATGNVLSLFQAHPVYARLLVENVGSTTVSVAMTAMQTGAVSY